MKHASLCLLSYKRPEALKECLKSLFDNTDYSYSLIVNADGGDSDNLDYLVSLQKEGRISSLIISGGKNRGVGRSFQNCLGITEGDYIFKIDADLVFKPYWLSTAIGILDNNPDVGAVSLFDYNHYDPNDDRFKSEVNHIENRADCIIVKDFVSSIYGFRAEELKKIIWVDGYQGIPDDGLHQYFGKMAITKKDYVINNGFGVTKSVYVSGTMDHPYKTPTYDEPLIFQR